MERISIFAQSVSRIPVYSDFYIGLSDMPGGLTPNIVIQDTSLTYDPFDLIDFILREYNLEYPELGGHAFPDTTYTAMKYDPRVPSPSINNAYFSVRVRPANNGEMMIGFKTRYTYNPEDPEPVTVWNTDESDSTYIWLDYRSNTGGYTGIDPGNITSADHTYNRLYFLHFSIGEYGMPSNPLNRTGILFRVSAYEKLWSENPWEYRGLDPAYLDLRSNPNIEGPDTYDNIYRYKCTGGLVYSSKSDANGYGSQTVYFGYQVLDLLMVCGNWTEEEIPDTWYDTGENPPNVDGGGNGYDKDGYQGKNPDDWPKPTKSISSVGMFQLYTPSTVQVRQLAQWLWSSDSETAYQRWGVHALDNIVMLGAIPFKLSSDIIGSNKDVYMMGYDTQVDMTELLSAYDIHSCGSISIMANKMSNSYLDYTNTSIMMYVPCVGIVPLKASDVINSNVTLRYRIDLLSGDFIAYLNVSRYENNNTKGTAYGPFTLYSWTGNCMQLYPLSSADYASYYTNRRNEMFGLLGNIVGAAGDGARALSGDLSAASSMLNKVNGMADNINWLKYQTPEVQRSGSLTSGLAMLCNPTPYIIIDRAQPFRYTPKNGTSYDGFYKWYGYPTMMTYKLKDIVGHNYSYTEVARVRVNISKATAKEKMAIENLLKQGVIIKKSS